MDWIQGWLPTKLNFNRFFSEMIKWTDNASGGALMDWIQGVAPQTAKHRIEFFPPLLASAYKGGGTFKPVLNQRKDRHLDKITNFNYFRSETFVHFVA